MGDLLRAALASVVGVIAVARAVRLVTSDAYPPMEWIRDRWARLTVPKLKGEPVLTTRGDLAAGPWTPLLTCPFCFAPYATAVDLTWAVLTRVELHGPWGVGWWLINGWAAAAYVAAMIVVRDEPPPVEES